jgi:integrase
MSSPVPIHHPEAELAFGMPKVATLAEVLDALDAEASLTPRQRADLRSAVITGARMLGLPPASIPARLDLLRRQLSQVLHAAHGMSRVRWNTVRSQFGKALRLAGLEVLPGRSLAELDPAWADLRTRLTSRTHRDRLSRLMHFCSAGGIMPEEVDDAVIERFRTAMLDGSLIKKPMIAAQRAVVCWNEAVAQVPGWPQRRLTVLELRDRYSLPLAQFPAGFQEAVEAYLDHLAGGDRSTQRPFQAQRPRTIASRRYQLRQLASALVLSGREAVAIESLADLVEPTAAWSAMRFILKRNGNKVTTQTGGLAGLLLSVGRHWVKVGAEDEAALKDLARRCRPVRRGMTQKNRATLRQFNDHALARRLLGLPDLIHEELSRQPELTPAQAQRLMRALAVGLLLAAPIRLQNLTGLDLQRHLIRVGHGRDTRWHIYLPAEEVKNATDLEYPLPPAVGRLLEFYLAKARPRLATPGCTALFVSGRGGGPRNPTAFSTALREFVGREVGVRITTHQFRHVAGFLYLQQVPGDYETVRALLGHQSIETTIRYYAGMETAAAARAYDAAVLRAHL